MQTHSKIKFPFDARTIFCAVVLMLWCYSGIYCQASIDATGSWGLSLSSTDVPDAGADINGTYTSATNQVLIDVSNNTQKWNWRVDIRKSDVSWNASLLLYARRTGDGTGHPQRTISGGTTYIQLTSSNQTFFTGSRDTFSIPIQFQVTGVSVLIPAQTYTSTVIYTVTEI